MVSTLKMGGIISASIVVTSAVAFYGKGIPLETGAQLAQQLKPLFGSFTNFLFGLGFFAVGLSSALIAPFLLIKERIMKNNWSKAQRSSRILKRQFSAGGVSAPQMSA